MGRALLVEHGNLVVANKLPREVLDRYGTPARTHHCQDIEVRVYRGKRQRRLFGEFRTGLHALDAK